MHRCAVDSICRGLGLGKKLVEELITIAEQLGGNIQRLTVYDSKGRQSKKIVIEYDVKEKDAT